MARTGLWDHVTISGRVYWGTQIIVLLVLTADIVSDVLHPLPWVFPVDVLEVLFWGSIVFLERRKTVSPLHALGLLGFLMGLLLAVDPVVYFLGMDPQRPFLFTMNFLGTAMLLTGSSLILGRAAGIAATVLVEALLVWGFLVHGDENAPISFFLLAVIILLFSTVIFLFRRALKTLYHNLEKEKEAALRAAQTIKEMQLQIRRKEKVAYMSSLAAGIAHELKNPLNLLINFAESSEEMVTELQNLLPSEQKREVQTLLEELKLNQREMVSQGRLGESIINSIQRQAKMGTTPRMQENLNLLVEESLDMAEKITKFRSWTPPVLVELSLDPRLPALTLARSEILQVLLNLLQNALYSLKKKSEESIPDFAPSLRLTTGAGEAAQILSVEDNGQGFPQEQSELLFQAFYTTKPSLEGSGLGLSICREIAQNHGGSLTARGTPGKGAVFTLVLPDRPEDRK